MQVHNGMAPYQVSFWSSLGLAPVSPPARWTAPLTEGSGDCCWRGPGRSGSWCTWWPQLAAMWAGCCANREVWGWAYPWGIPRERRWGHSRPDAALPGWTALGNYPGSGRTACWKTSTGIPDWRGSWRLRSVSAGWLSSQSVIWMYQQGSQQAQEISRDHCKSRSYGAGDKRKFLFHTKHNINLTVLHCAKQLTIFPVSITESEETFC